MKHIIILVLIVISSVAFAQPWNEHGSLKASENGHFLTHQDGTLFYWNGDTPWALVTLDPQEVDEYLMDRASRKFNVIQVMAVIQMKAVRSKKNEPEYGFSTKPGFNNYFEEAYNGEIPFNSIDPIEFNEAYWKHIDYIVENAAEYGIYVTLTTMWGYGAGTIFNDPEKDNYDYGVMLAKRYKDRPNVIWNAAGEFVTVTGGFTGPINKQQEQLLRAIGQGLKKGCEGKQLVTIHGNQSWNRMPSAYFHKDDWLDFHMNQSWDRFGFIDSMTVNDWNLENPKPTMLGEAKYEGSYYPNYTKNIAKGDKTGDWHIRLQAYWSVFSGGFGHTYGAYGIWNCDGYLNKTILNYPGADDMQYLRQLIESKPSLTRVYDSSFIEHNIKNGRYELNVVIGTWDDTKTWAFIYASKGATFSIDLTKFKTKTLTAKWFNPRLGIYKRLGEYDTDMKQEFIPPNKKGEQVSKSRDWVLVLEKAHI